VGVNQLHLTFTKHFRDTGDRLYRIDWTAFSNTESGHHMKGEACVFNLVAQCPAASQELHFVTSRPQLARDRQGLGAGTAVFKLRANL
jgi:hypothetical protein